MLGLFALLLLAAEPSATETAPGLSAQDRIELKHRQDELAHARPSLIPPIVLIAGSEIALAEAFDLLATATGFSLGVGSGLSADNSSSGLLIGLGIALIAGGVVLGVVGTIKLFEVLKARSELGAQMDRIREQLDADPGMPVSLRGFLKANAGFTLARF